MDGEPAGRTAAEWEVVLKYSALQRLSYLVRRHLFFWVVLAASMIYLRTIDDGVLLAMLVQRAARTCLGISLAILAAKFGFPKLDIQKELCADQNVAIGIVMGAVIIGANL